jgi:hypothetical protein
MRRTEGTFVTECTLRYSGVLVETLISLCWPKFPEYCATIWGRRGVYTGFWWGNLREIVHFVDPGVDGRITLRLIFWKWGVGHGLG